MKWVKTSDRKPDEHQIVLVHGGIAQFRAGVFWTGMEDPRYLRPINWEVTHWIPLSELVPPSANSPVIPEGSVEREWGILHKQDGGDVTQYQEKYARDWAESFPDQYQLVHRTTAGPWIDAEVKA